MNRAAMPGGWVRGLNMAMAEIVGITGARSRAANQDRANRCVDNGVVSSFAAGQSVRNCGFLYSKVRKATGPCPESAGTRRLRGFSFLHSALRLRRILEVECRPNPGAFD